MASDQDEEYDDLKQYFTAAGWKEISNYEKLRLQNIKRNYEMMIEIGLTVSMPDFMVQKRKKPSRKRTHTGSSNEDDEEWLPFKKSNNHSGNTSTKQCRKKQESMVRSAFNKSKNKASGDEPDENASEDGRDLSYCARRKLGSEVKKGKKKKKKKPKVPERCYPKRRNTHKCYKEETVPDDDHFIYCEDCQEFYETGCLQHPLTIIEDTPVPARSKTFCRESLPSGLTIKETTILGAGLGVFAEKNFKKGVRFGPYKGKVVGELDALSSGYAWEICAKGKPSHYVDAKSEYSSNWMRFVNCARNEKEQNLVAFQYLGQIYYRSFKPISAGTELLVYYGKDYAKDLGIEMVPPSTNARLIKQSKSKDDKSFRCEECGNMFTIHIYLLKHLKYSHGKPIYFPRKVQRSFHSPVMLPKRVGQGILDAQKHQVPLFDAEMSSENHDSFNRSVRKGPAETLTTVGTEFPESKNHNEKSSIVNSLSEVDQKICETLLMGERKLYNEASVLHYTTDTRNEQFSMTLAPSIQLSPHKVQSQVQTMDYLVTKYQSSHQSSALKSCTTKHKGEKPYQCKTCGQTFTLARNLKTHERIHSGEKPYQCKTCGKSFNNEVYMKTHERIHSGEKPYQCKTCGQIFTLAHHLKTHERIHSGEKPYQCKTCGKSFNQVGNMKTHERIHSGEKPYQCKTCGKSFNLAFTLKAHERIHSGEKPYQCKTCGKSFNVANNMKKHERIHSGENPYQCKTCGKSFNQASNLKRHERIHSGEKPYQCKTCGKSFNQSNSMKTHERTHSGERIYHGGFSSQGRNLKFDEKEQQQNNTCIRNNDMVKQVSTYTEE